MRYHTDLAMEVSGGVTRHDQGIQVDERQMGRATLTTVDIVNEKGERQTGKPVGRYVTAYCEDLCVNDPDTDEEISRLLGRLLFEMLPERKKEDTVLVVGLGNRAITPDALGSKVVGNVFVSRHIIENMPDAVDERMTNVCAIAPGVLGVTGVETGEIVLGVVEKVRPACVIAIDSLAARSLTRVLTTVQLSNTGIRPGSGLNNPRKELTAQTLGVPVLAIGVPLVVSAMSICADALEAAGCHMDDRVERALGKQAADMVVTPKEIDEAVDNAAHLIAMGINLALHPEVGYEDFLPLR